MESKPTHDQDRRELEALARRGDQSARASLLSGARAGLVRFCRRYLDSLDEAEDAAQDVMASVSAEGGWPQGRLHPWLLRSARNRCIDLRRKRKDGREGAGSFLASSRLASPRTGPGTAFARREEEERLHEHLSALPEAQAEVLMLFYFDSLGRREIAEVLELPESIVKSRLFEGRQSLRRRLEET